MERMWAHEHQDRPTMSEVVQELQDLVQQYR
jgi:mitogen-activated protein kinase kinase kinase 13